MKVLLKADVPGVGKAGEVKEVKDGFARNYLIPRGLAVEATKSVLKTLQTQRAVREEKLSRQKKESEALLKRISASPVVIKVKAGEAGKIFGSVTNTTIAAELSARYNAEFDKHWITLDSTLKRLGVYKVALHLPGGVKGEIVVKLEAE